MRVLKYISISISRREVVEEKGDMKLDVMVCVSPDGKLEIPAEIETQFKPGDQ